MTGPHRCIWALLIALTIPAPSIARTGAEAAEAKRKAAQAYLNIATSLFRNKDYEGALAELQRAEPLVEKTSIFPLVRFNIARCYEELGLHLQTLAAYRRYLETGEKSTARQARAHQVIKSLRAEHIGRLIVNCDPRDAEVRLVNQDQARQGCPADFGELLDGSYTVQVSRDGFETESRDVYVEASTTTRTNVALPRKRTPEVTMQRAEETVSVSHVSASGGIHRKWWLWGGAAMTGIAGAVFHSLAVSEAGAIEETPPSAARNGMLDTFETQRATSIALYGLSAALITTALITGQNSTREDVSTLWVTPGSLGASFNF